MVDSQMVRVVGAIIQRKDAVFAARRNPERSAGGPWEFPGGKVEPGETPEQALRREPPEGPCRSRLRPRSTTNRRCTAAARAFCVLPRRSDRPLPRRSVPAQVAPD